MKKRFTGILSLLMILSILAGYSGLTAYAEPMKKADIVFVIDSTGSMGDEIRNVKKNISDFMNLFKETGVKLRVGIIDYRDITCDGNASTVIHTCDGSVWHETVAQVVSTLGKISASGGGDTPETPIDALGYLTERWDRTSQFWDKDSSDWDPTVNRFAVLITDANYKNNNRHGYSDMDDLINDCVLSARKLTVSVVTDSYYNDAYKSLVERTGGIFGDINGNFAVTLQDLAKDMISKLDTDGDGLPDEWEHSGDIDGDGKADISDADPEKTDIYIQIDWMPGFRPTNTAMQTVVNAFKNSGAGYENKGINLHLVYGQQIPNRKVIDLSSDYSEWIDLANTYFADETARRVYRWALFANMYDLGDGTGSSGLASNIPGQMFMVTLGGWTFDTDADRDRVVASTFMHELGHTLGLKHGGCDHINGKPNYISIMSYTYQLYGLNPGGIVDYSHEELPPIDPEHVNENDGIDPDGISKTGCAWYFGGYRYSLTSAKGAIDFNQDGKLEDSVEIDFKDSHGRSLPKKTYYGNNDWASIVCYGGTVGYQGDTMPAPEVNPPEEITEEQDFEEFLEQKEQIEPSSGKAKISINNYTASTTVPFRATMVLTAIFENAPKGSEVHWYVDGKHIGEGDTLTATNIREKFTAQAKLRDKDGNILASSEMETVNVRSGIIARIVAFFRSIFGMLPTIYQ